MNTNDGQLTERREAMIDILASWDLEGALPDAAGMDIVREYVDGRLTTTEMIDKMRSLPLPSESESRASA